MIRISCEFEIVYSPATNKENMCTSIINPHHPPANTFVVQKLAATLPSSDRQRTITANNSMIPNSITKNFGQIRRKLSSYAEVIFTWNVTTKYQYEQ